MSTEPDLRAAFAAAAERAPITSADAEDLWTRGRRTGRRHRLAAGGSILAVLAIVAGLGFAVAGRQDQHPQPATDGVGVPSHLYRIPDSFPISDDLAVGTAAAAYVAQIGGRLTAVVISADDGSYHRLALPGLDDGVMGLSTVMALSPDGRSLAYVEEAADGSTGDRESGVRVVDLRTGTFRTVPIGARRSVKVFSIGWSAAGSIHWSGMSVASTAPLSGTQTLRTVTGRILPGTDRSIPVPDGDAPPLLTRSVTQASGGFPTLAGQLADGTRVLIGRGSTIDSPPAFGLQLGTRFVRVGTTQVTTSISIATGLMTRADPVVERPTPSWSAPTG